MEFPTIKLYVFQDKYPEKKQLCEKTMFTYYLCFKNWKYFLRRVNFLNSEKLFRITLRIRSIEPDRIE